MLKTIGAVSKKTRVCLTPITIPDGVGTYMQWRDSAGNNYLSPGEGRSPVPDVALCVTYPNP